MQYVIDNHITIRVDHSDYLILGTDKDFVVNSGYYTITGSERDQRETKLLAQTNHVFHWLSIDDQISIVRKLHELRSILNDHKRCIEMTNRANGDIICKLGHELTELKFVNHMRERLYAYVQSGVINLADFGNAGKRAHDTEELTFYTENVYYLTVFSLMAKLLFPFTAELMKEPVDTTYTPFNRRELKVVEYLTPLFNCWHPETFHKISHTIFHVINKSGSIPEEYHANVYLRMISMFMIRYLVTMDLSTSLFNPVKYLSAYNRHMLDWIRSDLKRLKIH